MRSQESSVVARLATFALVLVLLASAAPGAVANHWTLHHMGLDPDLAHTREDDGVTLPAPGNPLDGMTNKVALGVAPGDGSLFLDARLANRLYGGGDGDFDVRPGLAFGIVADRPDLLLPGPLAVSAWYGEWLDHDGDGVILDVHDSSGDPLDEFRWRGIATDEAVEVVAFLVPAWQAERGYMQSGLGNPASFARFPLKDFTSTERVEQGWTTPTAIGGQQQSLDAGFLATVHTVTIAGAATASGTPVRLKLDDPAGLYDVDRYESLNPDVESLYLVSARSVNEADQAAREAALGAVKDANDLVFGSTDFVFRLVFEDVYGTARALVDELDPTSPPNPMPVLAPGVGKEPNTGEDDYEGRAWFGNVGDAQGSYNQYPGYENGFHYYFDAVPRTFLCAGLRLQAPGVPVAVDRTHCSISDYDPLGGAAYARRSSGLALGFTGHSFLWHDLNRDTHVGTRCDPGDPDSFDAERNTCRGAASTAWPHDSDGSIEKIGVCAASTVRTTLVRVTPVGGDWSNALLVRDAGDLLSATTWRILEGRETVELRWRDNCEAFNFFVHTRDALLFLDGASRVPLRVESVSRLDRMYDASLGVDVDDEGVVDVDLLPATL